MDILHSAAADGVVLESATATRAAFSTQTKFGRNVNSCQRPQALQQHLTDVRKVLLQELMKSHKSRGRGKRTADSYERCGEKAT